MRGAHSDHGGVEIKIESCHVFAEDFDPLAKRVKHTFDRIGTMPTEVKSGACARNNDENTIQTTGLKGSIPLGRLTSVRLELV